MVDQRDRMPQGDPDTVVLLQGGALIGLYIMGVRAWTMLGIREDAEGQPVSCAITNEVYIDAADWKSNPRRQADGDDGAD